MSLSIGAEKINLLDLVDKKFLQEFQDNFAKTTGLASVTIDENGFITEPSNFTDFCIMMKSKDKSSSICSKCDLEKKMLGFKSQKPFTYTCHAGLTVFVVPVVVNNKTIALMIGGQTFTEEPPEEFYKKLAKDSELSEKECLENVRKIMHSTKEEVENATNLLSQVANAISNMAHKNYELQEINFREKLLREVAEVLRSSLDLIKIKQDITNLIGKAFNADRCYFRSYDKVEGKFLAVDVEYLGSKSVTSLIGVEPNHEGLKFFTDKINLQKQGFYPIVADKDFAKDSPLASYFKQANIVADYAIPITDRYDELTWFVLHYAKKDPKLSEDEKKLLESIGYQIATAFEQIKLYGKEKQTAQREALLRKITSAIRKSLNIEETFSVICSEIGRIASANRVTITQRIDSEGNHIIKGEFKSREEVKSASEISQYERIKIYKYMSTVVFKSDKPLVVNDVDESDMPDYVKKFYKNLGVKSLVVLPIKKGKDAWGILTISHVDNFKDWTPQEIDFVKVIIEQVYIAINQAELYSKMQQQNAREKAILANLPFMVWLKDTEGRFLAVNSEFAKACGTTVDKVIGKTDYDFWTKELADSYAKADKEVIQKKITYSVDELIEGLDGARWHEAYKTPIYNDKNEVVGTTGFARDITESKEAQEKIIKAAERETVLRKIIEKIRISLDIEEVLLVICEEVAKLFNVQRTVIACDSEDGNPNMFSKRKDYRVSQDLPVIKDEDTYNYVVKIWTESVIDTGKTLVINNMTETDLPEPFKDAYIRVGVKSAIGSPIKKGNKVWGNLILFDYNQLRPWTDEEQYLLEAIANQIYIAIHQAEIFEKEKQSANREILLRKITETIRQTLDVNETKKTIVTEVGKALNADIAYIVEYEPETNTPKMVDDYSEYRVDESVKSLIGYDFSGAQLEFLLSFHKQNKLVYMQNADAFLKENNLFGTGLEKWIRDENIKSAIGMSMFYGGKIFGVLSVHYTKSEHPMTEEYVELFRVISVQSGIALYQAKLYEKIQMQAEREKMSRNIIEILRSSIDKTIIKKLFVKNLGKFFNADRVFLTEYDAKANILMPIDASSEYLSSLDEKTATNYDFTSPEFSQHVEALLEKRELRVEDFEEFVKQNHGLDEKLIEHYNDANTKSSYAFPIVYQNQIMGAFAIQFTHQVVKLSEEDLSRIRSICTQAGIALYHANLYEKAKECELSRQSFMSKISEKIEKPVHEIIDISTNLVQNEFEHFIEVEYLNKIIGSCNHLLELTAEGDED